MLLLVGPILHMVPKTTRPLGQIVPKTTYLELYATRHPSYAVRYTLYRTNNLWDKSFQKQALGQIVPKTTLGQIVPKKKTSQRILPTKPSLKKGAGRAPREADSIY